LPRDIFVVPFKYIGLPKYDGKENFLKKGLYTIARNIQKLL
jgi:hypothetical protein